MVIKRWTCAVLALLVIAGLGLAAVGCKKGPARGKKEFAAQEFKANKSILLATVTSGLNAEESIKAAKELGEIGDIGDAIGMATDYQHIADESVRAAAKEAIERIEAREGQRVPDMMRQALDY